MSSPLSSSTRSARRDADSHAVDARSEKRHTLPQLRSWPALSALTLLVLMTAFAVYNLTRSVDNTELVRSTGDSLQQPLDIQAGLEKLETHVINIGISSSDSAKATMIALIDNVRSDVKALNPSTAITATKPILQQKLLTDLTQLERLVTITAIDSSGSPANLTSLALKKINGMIQANEHELAVRGIHERSTQDALKIQTSNARDHARWALLLLGLLSAGLVALAIQQWVAFRRHPAAETVEPTDNARLKNALEGLSDGCVVLNQERKVTAHNSSMAKLLPDTSARIDGANASSLYSQICLDSTQSRDQLSDWLNNLHADSTSVIEVMDHQNRHLMIRERPTSDGDITATIRDISDIKAAREKLQQATDYDSLTGLPNRALFMRELREYTREEEQTIALIICDLRDFRQINDSYGHDIGDELLISISASLFRHMPGDAVIARIAGDEFGVMIYPVPDKADVEEAIENFLEELKQGLKAGRQTIPVRASVGISYGPEHGVSPIELKNTADSACSQAKRQGTNTFTIFDRQLQEDADRGHLIDIGLLTAIDRNELMIEYQPQIDIRTNMTAGMEALIRWNNEELGRVSPAEFIPRAEKSGLIVELGEWILRRAIQDYQKLASVGMAPGILSVNLSRRQFDNPELITSLRRIIDETGMAPKMLTLEITETAILDDRKHAEEVLGQLHAIGVNLSIDDFGVGYSSFLELRDFPINEVKIDRSFVTDVVTCDNSRKIIQAIVNVANAIGAEVVAEGIESREQFDVITELGCHRAQGYFLCEPMSPTTFPDVVLGGGDMTLAL